jgi:hypothetical protein
MSQGLNGMFRAEPAWDMAKSLSELQVYQKALRPPLKFLRSFRDRHSSGIIACGIN